jgi:hypothetical protein
VFQGLFRAAHESLLEHKPEVLHTICDADFVTDSVTMVKLFKVASEVYRQGSRITTEIRLDLFVQVVNGKVFMRAFQSPRGHFRTDAIGQFVPPRFGFCDRMKEMDAQCFKRATTYKIRTTGPCAIPPYSILILDDNLLEVMQPGVQGDCVALRSCQHHGATTEHAVPVVIQDNHMPLVRLIKDGVGKTWSEILPRACFAGCDKVSVGRFGADLSKGFWETARPTPSHLFRVGLQSWEKAHFGQFWSLANLLQWIHIKAQGLASTHGRDTNFRVTLKATSFEQHDGANVPVYSLITERENTKERLVSMKDVDTLCRWMTEPGWRYPSEEHPPPYAPVAHPPPAHAD